MARVLIIDDDVDFCSMMEDLLRTAGHEPFVSPHSIIGTEEALSGEYDVVTLDLRMPDLDGSEISELFDELGLEIPVIVISGHLTSEIRESLRKAGITRVLQKPFKTADLMSAIDSAVA